MFLSAFKIVKSLFAEKKKSYRKHLFNIFPFFPVLLFRFYNDSAELFSTYVFFLLG